MSETMLAVHKIFNYKCMHFVKVQMYQLEIIPQNYKVVFESITACSQKALLYSSIILWNNKAHTFKVKTHNMECGKPGTARKTRKIRQ